MTTIPGKSKFPWPEPDKSHWGWLRDWLAWKLATAAFQIATPWYRQMINGSIRLGLKAAREDFDASKPKFAFDYEEKTDVHPG